MAGSSQLCSKILVSIFIVLSPSAAGQEVRFRHDLLSHQAFICGLKHQPSIRRLWDQGIHSAGGVVEFYKTSPHQKKQINQRAIEQLESAARRQAARLFHHGFSYGVCLDKGHAFTMSTPSPWPLPKHSPEGLAVPNDWHKYCSKIQIDFAATGTEFPETIASLKSPSQHLKLPPQKHLDSGTLSLTCWSGKENRPHLWHLIPFNRSQNSHTPPHWAPHGRPLREWINQVRYAMGLNPLENHLLKLEGLNPITRRLSVSHRLPELRLLQQYFEGLKGKFIGENRVIGKSSRDQAWLIWNSPRHRDLILAPQASHISTETVNATAGSLTVLVVSRFF